MNVSLLPSQREFVETAAKESGCTNSSEYVRRLIHDAQQRSEQQRLEKLILEGLESGEGRIVDSDFWESKRAALTAKLKSDNK